MNSKKVNPALIIVLVLIILVTGGYLGAAYYYSERFSPNTIIDGVDYSGMTPAMADQTRYQNDNKYTLTITGRDGARAVLNAEDLGFSCSYSKSMSEVLKEQNPFAWGVALVAGYDFKLEQTVSCDQAAISKALSDIDFLKDSNMEAPTDAFIGDYEEEKGEYSIVPETEGTTVEMDSLLNSINDAIVSKKESIDLEKSGCYKEPSVRADDTELTDKLALLNTYKDTIVNYQYGDKIITVNFDDIHNMIDVKKDSVSVSADKVAAFVDAFADKYDTCGKEMEFTTVSGDKILLKRGNSSGNIFGWKIDREAEARQLYEDIEKGVTTTRPPMLLHEGWTWIDENNDIGDTYVEVNMTLQKVYLVQHNAVVYVTDCVTGRMTSDRMTPEGIYGVKYKARNATLRGPDYESHVKFWMPFNKGVGLHDALWRGRFGGTIYKYSGSHGCVNLPLKAAEKIYDTVEVGYPVICYYVPEKTEEERAAEAAAKEESTGNVAASVAEDTEKTEKTKTVLDLTPVYKKPIEQLKAEESKKYIVEDAETWKARKDAEAAALSANEALSANAAVSGNSYIDPVTGVVVTDNAETGVAGVPVVPQGDVDPAAVDPAAQTVPAVPDAQPVPEAQPAPEAEYVPPADPAPEPEQ